MEISVLETVLTEVLQELKDLNNSNKNLAGKQTQLEEKVTAFDQKLEQVQLLPPPVDFSPISTVVQENMTSIAKIVEGQPKNVIRKLQIQFFPEKDTKEYYQFIGNYIIPWLIAALLLCLGCRLGLQALNNAAVQDQQNTMYQHYHRAWIYMDTTAGPALHQRMNEVWDHVGD